MGNLNVSDLHEGFIYLKDNQNDCPVPYGSFQIEKITRDGNNGNDIKRIDIIPGDCFSADPYYDINGFLFVAKAHPLNFFILRSLGFQYENGFFELTFPYNNDYVFLKLEENKGVYRVNKDTVLDKGRHGLIKDINSVHKLQEQLITLFNINPKFDVKKCNHYYCLSCSIDAYKDIIDNMIDDKGFCYVNHIHSKIASVLNEHLSDIDIEVIIEYLVDIKGYKITPDFDGYIHLEKGEYWNLL